MRTFIAVALAVSVHAVDLSTETEVNAELQALANAAMVNDYILAQVERLNAEESDLA